MGVGETRGLVCFSVILPGGFDVEIGSKGLNARKVTCMFRRYLPTLAQVQNQASGSRDEVLERDDFDIVPCDDEVGRPCHCAWRRAKDVDAKGVLRVDGLHQRLSRLGMRMDVCKQEIVCQSSRDRTE